MIGFGLCVPALRGTGSLTGPPPAPAFTLTETGDGRLLISDVQAELSIEIRSPDAHAGTFAVPWQDYAAGIVPLMAPAIAGDPAPGAVLEAVPGLWLHQGPDPVSSWCWQVRPEGGTFADLPDTTAPSLTVTAEMQGQEIRVVEVVADGVEAASAPVAVPAAPVVPDFTLTEDTDGQILLGDASGALEITITDPPAYAGTHLVPAADYGDGIALVVPPVVEGTPEPGGTLTARPGLWLFAGTPPDLTLQWQSSADGGASWTDLAGETGPALVPGAVLDGQQVRLVERLGTEPGASAAVTIGVPQAGTSLIDFAATAPRITGGVTVAAMAGGWTMVPAQDGGTPAASGSMAWDIGSLSLTAGQDYVFALRLRRAAAELAGETTRIRTGANNALSSSADNLGTNVLEDADDVTFSLTFTHDGTDTRIGVRTDGWDPLQEITATDLSLTEQTT